MTPRLTNPFVLAPAAIKALYALEGTFKDSGLEFELMELVKIRASQINGCAFCLHMHTTDARAHGMDEYRIHLLAAWRESSLYSHRERAALAWTEALTLVAETGAPDAVYALLAEAFSEAEQVQLTIAIGAINLWNRLQVGFRAAHPEGTSHAAA
ncbi:carboxymuconolactone decarboxylase family protein [Novosphingobium resinovorum]|uniref:carboxymuconolactone decarboxylase family protein n=1 Tax=Novosphingobium resinovorum TaxID=158500 RepID=UPI002ED60289|nr:carboxymuconolactone decarboxylase family protein [Novosphingobium resinovorum]